MEFVPESFPKLATLKQENFKNWFPIFTKQIPFFFTQMIPRSGFFASRFFNCLLRSQFFFFYFSAYLCFQWNRWITSWFALKQNERFFYYLLLSWNRRFDEVKQKKQKFKTGVNFSSFCLDAKRTKRSRLESFTSVLFNVFIGVSESLRDLSKKLKGCF